MRTIASAIAVFWLIPVLGRCQAVLGPPIAAPTTVSQPAPEKGPPPKVLEGVEKIEKWKPPLPAYRGQGEQPQPIDLATALQLADGQNPDIAFARERIREALAQQDRAEALWLPHLDIAPFWNRHDGQIQRTEGDVITVSRSALFVGGGPTLDVDLGRAWFSNLAARQLTAARQAAADAVRNERTLEVALSYIDLLQAAAEVQIAVEAFDNAR